MWPARHPANIAPDEAASRSGSARDASRSEGIGSRQPRPRHDRQFASGDKSGFAARKSSAAGLLSVTTAEVPFSYALIADVFTVRAGSRPKRLQGRRFRARAAAIVLGEELLR